MTETAVVSACLQWLQLNGCYVWRNNTGATKTASGGFMRFGKAGSADILGCNPYGRFLAVECKYGKGKQSEAQKKFETNVTAKGGLYVLAYGVDDMEKNRGYILQQSMKV